MSLLLLFTPSPAFPAGQIDISAHIYRLPDFTTELADLTLTHSRTWQEGLSEPGAGSITFQNDDPDLATIQGDGLDLITFRLAGIDAFTLICENAERVQVGPEEEAGDVTEWSGRGHLALVERAAVYPSRGLYVKPVEDDRVFNFSAFDYDDSTWDFADTLDLYPARGVPTEAWPDPTAAYLWDSGAINGSGDVRSGYVYFRKSFTLATETLVILFGHADDWATFYMDGIPILSTENNGLQGTPSAFTAGTAHIVLSAGTHVLAVEALNYWFLVPGAPDVDPNPGVPYTAVGNNEAALIAALYVSDPITIIGPLILHTDGSWLMESYPPDGPPGMSPGEVIRHVVEEAQARGALSYVALQFTDDLDSDGAAWTLTSNISTKVGTDLLSFFQEMASSYVDLWMKPGTGDLFAYEYGTRGSNVGVVFESPTDPEDPESGNLTNLVFRDVP